MRRISRSESGLPAASMFTGTNRNERNVAYYCGICSSAQLDADDFLLKDRAHYDRS